MGVLGKAMKFVVSRNMNFVYPPCEETEIQLMLGLSFRQVPERHDSRDSS